MPIIETKQSRTYAKVIGLYLALVVPPIIVAYLVGHKLSLIHYALYCVYALPMESVRRFIRSESHISLKKWLILLFYSLGLSALLVWAITS